MQNKTKKYIGKTLIAAGIILVAASALSYGFSLYIAYRAGKAAEDTLDRLKVSEDSADDWKTVYEETEEPEEETEEEIRDMPVIYIDGYGYIGYLSVPAYDLELPIMDEWSMDGLDIAPGRYSGSVYTDDMVIAGHNYARHFSPLKWADIGTKVIFTDMDDIAYYYQISEIETLQPTQVKEMISPSDDWDLTLFTCTTGGAARCAIRCKKES